MSLGPIVFRVWVVRPLTSVCLRNQSLRCLFTSLLGMGNFAGFNLVSTNCSLNCLMACFLTRPTCCARCHLPFRISIECAGDLLYASRSRPTLLRQASMMYRLNFGCPGSSKMFLVIVRLLCCVDYSRDAVSVNCVVWLANFLCPGFLDICATCIGHHDPHGSGDAPPWARFPPLLYSRIPGCQPLGWLRDLCWSVVNLQIDSGLCDHYDLGSGRATKSLL